MHNETPRKKFEITETAPPYEPSVRPEPHFLIVEDLTAADGGNCSDTHRLYITLEAMQQIAQHIGWGRHTEHNRTEQGGLLLGQVSKDVRQGITYGVVSAAVEGRSARGSSAYLEMTHETWKEMLDAADAMMSRQPDRSLQVIGWYHTHPNDLSVFMSGTDTATQRRLFARDWQFAVVLNPHHRRWRAFYGRDATECRGFVCDGVEEPAPGEGLMPAAFAPPGESGDAREAEAEDEGAVESDGAAEDGEFRARDARRTRRVGVPRIPAAPSGLLWVCLALILLLLLLQLATIGLQCLALCLRS